MTKASSLTQTWRRLLGACCLALCAVGAWPAQADERFITVASTTSTEQSGLFAHLLPVFEQASGIKVRVVALGTGQALDLARRGDADVVFVHDKAAEEKFVAEGFGVQRFEVMYNDFVLIGPRNDPAQVAGHDILEGLRRIASADISPRPPFVSRGDRSGTHMAELRYWKAAGVDLDQAKGAWYRDTGSGMGPALNTAAAMNAYILADRGTWLNFRNRGDLRILVEGDTRLFNQYGVMLVNPAKHPHVKKDDGQKFIDWLLSPVGQQTITAYKINGEQLFFPNARR
ncbi:MAG: tungsten ABC transporter substrate-binding protein [Betaproteobacteria bacterium HGW-Betaproteobacteria-11]|nr:MAG: tungsten ABC transporter substrate-binding protein [Betaproteobacteria bacterium HGW-Betaproteobacteria-11]